MSLGDEKFPNLVLNILKVQTLKGDGKLLKLLLFFHEYIIRFKPYSLNIYK